MQPAGGEFDLVGWAALALVMCGHCFNRLPTPLWPHPMVQAKMGIQPPPPPNAAAGAQRRPMRRGRVTRG